MNPLNDRPDLRKKVYSVFWLVGLALGALAAGYGASDNDAPEWLNPATAAYAFLGAGVGYTASQNTPKDEG
jgi:hypothetical protein